MGDATGRKYWWSLYRVSGEPWFAGVLFVAAAFFALLLLVGYRTRLSMIASWILLVSVQARNPLVRTGGDDLLGCALLWSMFLPLGAAASLDSLLRPSVRPHPKRVLSAASVALLMQIVMVYLFSAIMKIGPRWTTEHSAVYYTMNLDMYTTPLGRWLLAYPALMRFLTVATFWLEMLGPAVAFSPLFRGPLRMLTVLAFGAFTWRWI